MVRAKGKTNLWFVRDMSRHLITLVAGMAVFVAWAGALRAGMINLPNGSFESPVTPFVNTHIDAWQETPKPDDYVEGNGFTWDQLTGVFKNTPTNSSDHIDNCDGDQCAYLFAVPQVGFFQDYDSIDWAHTNATHDFNVAYEAGKSYHLMAGVIGGGGGMMNGASLELSLYYRDGASNLVTVATTSITNRPEVFSNNTHLIDFQVDVPAVKADDAWAGQHIGVRFLSTVSSNLAAGYWDLDNVRLSSVVEPVLQAAALTNGQFQFTLQSEPALNFEILATTNIGLSLSNWMSLGTLTNVTGTVLFTDTAPNFNQRFYRARQLP